MCVVRSLSVTDGIAELNRTYEKCIKAVIEWIIGQRSVRRSGNQTDRRWEPYNVLD